MSPFVSVIIPTHNRRQFIGDTVTSVLSQTHKDLEVIVVDDGSTDDTQELLKARHGSEPRFRYIWQENSERAVARNTGLKAARGEFIAFLDSDDLWRPTKLEKQLDLLAVAPPVAFVHSAYTEISVDGQSLREIDHSAVAGDLFRRLLWGNLIGSPTPLVRRSALQAAGGFNEDPALCCFEDWELWTRLAYRTQVGYIAESLAYYRVHPGNTGRSLTRAGCRAYTRGLLSHVTPVDGLYVRWVAMRHLLHFRRKHR